MRDVVLDGEDVFHLAVIGFRPHVAIGRRIDQLRGDAHPAAGLPDAAFENGGHPQFTGHGGDVDRFPFEYEGGRARGDFELGQLHQQVEDFLGDAVTEILVFHVAAHVGEGQYRDRVIIGRAGGQSGGRLDRRLRRRGFCRLRRLRFCRAGARYAFRTDVEGPGHQQRDRKAQRHQHDHQRRGPVRQIQARQNRRGNLDDDPAGDRVEDEHAENTAAA